LEDDPELRGHYVRVRPTGAKTFCAVARAPNGKQVWHTIGASSLYTVAKAREKARAAIVAIQVGLDRDGPETFEAVAESWFRRHVQAKKLISGPHIRRTLDCHLLPAWGSRDFAGIRRGDVAKLLDTVEDSASATVADFALATLRGLCNWYATRHDDYQSPIVRGMKRSDARVRARARILDDDEIRAVWRAAEANGAYGACIRIALLTAQRRETVTTLRFRPAFTRLSTRAPRRLFPRRWRRNQDLD
jgi:Arm DNA-binding domain